MLCALSWTALAGLVHRIYKTRTVRRSTLIVTRLKYKDLEAAYHLLVGPDSGKAELGGSKYSALSGLEVDLLEFDVKVQKYFFCTYFF